MALHPTLVLFLPSLAGGGAERVFVDLANDFASRGVNVDLVLASAEGPYLREIAPAVNLVDIRARSVSASIPGLARHLRKRRPDAVLSGLDHANVAAVLACELARTGARCVVSMRSVPSALHREAGRLRAGIVLQGARVCCRFADAVIANSAGVAADVCRFLRIPERKITVIYNPLDIDSIERLSQEPAGHLWCAAGAAPLILSVGRLSPLKDFPTLIHAFSILRLRQACHLVILGEGPDRGTLETLVRQLRLEADVYIPGFVANPFAWMARAKVFVSSSLSEGCPNALMQALACGTPIVSTASLGGAGEILENGKWGRMVPVRDAEAMAEAIASTLSATSAPDVRRRARDFARERIAMQYLDVLLPGSRGFEPRS